MAKAQRNANGQRHSNEISSLMVKTISLRQERWLNVWRAGWMTVWRLDTETKAIRKDVQDGGNNSTTGRYHQESEEMQIRR